jgi:hypothetical protein
MIQRGHGMKKNKFKIGWQKYEDVMEKQLSCPILTTVMQGMMSRNIDNEEYDEDEILEEMDLQSNGAPNIIPVSEELLKEVTMLSNFDCWMAHTNFDITPQVKEKLDNVPGIELLKICSRYRFFIGVGTMFDFSDVRKNIESTILPEGE